MIQFSIHRVKYCKSPNYYHYGTIKCSPTAFISISMPAGESAGGTSVVTATLRSSTAAISIDDCSTPGIAMTTAPPSLSERRNSVAGQKASSEHLQESAIEHDK